MEELKTNLKRVALVVGTRPNFVKAIPVWREIREQLGALTDTPDKYCLLVHTGQHYSRELSDIFLEQFEVPRDQISFLEGYPKAGSPQERFSWIFLQLSEWFTRNKIEKVVVFGDVNSTLAGAMAASFLHLQLVHVEAGLRSFNRLMPEERNRVITDSLSHLLLVTEKGALHNLMREGLVGKAVHCGNTMIDTLVRSLPRIKKMNEFAKKGMKPGKYVLFTFHRQENVDSPHLLRKVLTCIDRLATELRVKILFSVHPRTRNAMKRHGLKTFGVKLCPPQGYLQMMNLVYNCGILVTDSGGLQEEAAYLGVPTITLRRETERPITVSKGWNMIISPGEKNLFQKMKVEITDKIGKRKEDLTVLKADMGEGKASQIMAKKILQL